MSILISALLSLLVKLVTEKFLAQAIVIGLKALATKTENTYDDELVYALEEALSTNQDRKE